MSTPLLRIEDLCWSFPASGRPLLHHISAEIPAGVTLITGDEGCGKTTLLQLLAGERQAQAGQILTDRPVSPQELQALSCWHDVRDTRFDAVAVSELFQQWVPAEEQAHLPPLIDGLDLAPHLNKPLYQLSTGGRRKVLIAASLARSCRLILLDQPFSALDTPSMGFLRRQFAARAARRDQALVIADYTAPEGVPLAATLELGP
ncbi:MAG: ATP-binding cassette domain-containing protein [Betaproteobacteria bacterium]|nr:ATP-binding cassette domain-containing protein [Betaproteobacteria bacterium]